MEERKISTNASCFLLKDSSPLHGWKVPLYVWLKENGFVSWGIQGVYEGLDWMYINLNSKVFALGMPGVKVASVIGEHAITIDEFKPNIMGLILCEGRMKNRQKVRFFQPSIKARVAYIGI